MDGEPKFKGVEIKKIGPLWSLEGDIIMLPSISYPLKGYNKKDIELTDEFKFIQNWADEWWESFPNCCDSHKRFNSLPHFDKQNYIFIKDQVLLSIRYFIHCMEENIENADWLKNIYQYYDYLNMNFGNPGLGDHIFQKGVILLIENVNFDTVEFTDDMRLQLLERMSPGQKELEVRRRNNGDLGELYTVFQNWLNSMPRIGEIASIKQQLTGKIPMNMFLTTVQVNQYSGYVTSNIKSVSQLVVDLENYTLSLLIAVQNSLEESFFKENKTLFALSEEKLRIRQDKLFGHSEDHNLKSKDFILEWLDMWIEYFTDFTTSKIHGDVTKIVRNTNTFLHKHLEVYDLLDATIAELRSEISTFMREIPEQTSKLVQEKMETIFADIERNEISTGELEKLNGKLISTLEKDEKNKITGAVSTLKKSNISIKSKIKISIPLFLFTRYEAELELNASDKIPTNISEIKSLLLE